MEEVIKIKGNKLLHGTVNISGSKNLCVALIPAALLSRDLVIIHNIPPISDVYHLIEILEYFNVCVQYHNDSLIIDSSNITEKDLTINAMTKLRASYYFYSVLTGMFKHLTTTTIGGCSLGERPIDLHLKAFETLGVKTKILENGYEFDGTKLHSGHILFDKISVGATINAVLLAVQIKGKTIIENAAIEPEVTELFNFLNAMGAKIIGIGTHTLTIYGGKSLKGCEFKNIPDRIEAGTYALIGAAVGQDIKIKNIIPEHLGSLLELFDVLKINYYIKDDYMVVSKTELQKGIIILTSAYPGFPTDLQQPLTTFLTINKETSVIIEGIYDNRFAHIHELNKMGADIMLNNFNIIIHGVDKLQGKQVSGKDLRGGASLVLAGLMAKGTTIVRGLQYINRGYENMVAKLKKLGANIELCMQEFEEE